MIVPRARARVTDLLGGARRPLNIRRRFAEPLRVVIVGPPASAASVAAGMVGKFDLSTIQLWLT